jgi:hypothetical protein
MPHNFDIRYDQRNNAAADKIDMSSIPNRKHVETCLRSQIRTKIAKMPQDEQDAARQAEKQRQETWQRQMHTLEQAQLASAQQQVLPDTAAMAAAQPASSPAKHTSFWLKFKRRKGQSSAGN